MSTTVTYKGSTLTTVDNQTRTLLTSGKYMEDDLTLVDVSGGGDTSLNALFQNEFDVNFVSSATSMKVMAFRANTRLKSLSMPNATELGEQVLYGANKLESIYFPLVNTVASNCLGYCSKLINPIAFPKLASIGGNGLGNLSVTGIDLGGEGGTLYASAFVGSTSLAMLVLRSATLKTLANINAFNNTPFKNGGTGGTLYVPNSLISSYQGASNWSTILGYSTNQIKSIESTHTDPNAPIDLTLYYADGTPISA